MLSKVLKGGDALRAEAIVFDAVHAPAQQSRQPVPAENGHALEEHARRVRQLEAEIGTARKEAFEAGLRQGGEEAQSALSPVLARLNASIAEITQLRSDLRRRAEKDTVDLALKIAGRVLHRELSIDENALNALARVVFDRLARSESWRITVHPRFADALRGALPAGSVEKVRIDADPLCEPGTLRVSYEDGVVDASIDTQLAEIGRGLADRLERR